MTDRALIAEARNVGYAYPRMNTQTLKQATFEIRAGEFVAVMGRTGAGKTTLLSLLNGLIPQFHEGTFSGDVVVSRMNTRNYRVQTLARRVGMVLQDTEAQIIGSTVFNDVVFGPCNLGLPREQVIGNARQALEAVSLTGCDGRSPTTLSGGEMQRLAVAGILAMEPVLIVLDEPTSELDPRASVALFELLDRLRRSRPMAVVMSSHDTELVARFADRLIVVDGGIVVWDGPPRELFSDVLRCDVYGIRPPQMVELVRRLQTARMLPAGSAAFSVQEVADLIRPFFARAWKLHAPAHRLRHDLPGTPVAVDIDRLHHSYRSSPEALQGISLKIRQGEFVAIVGKNGAGKSTLAKHLNGLLQPDSGHVIVNGKDTRSCTVARLSHEVGFVFQNPDHQIFSSSVNEEMAFGLRHVAGISPAEIQQRILSALTFVGLQGMGDRHPFTLGKGERQLLAVATVLAVAPPILVIDEPTTGLDWRGTQRMMFLIHELHARNHTIIIITHDMQLAAEHAGRIVVMKAGSVVADGPPATVFKERTTITDASLAVPPMAELASMLVNGQEPLPAVSVEQMLSLLFPATPEGDCNAH